MEFLQFLNLSSAMLDAYEATGAVSASDLSELRATKMPNTGTMPQPR